MLLWNWRKKLLCRRESKGFQFLQPRHFLCLQSVATTSQKRETSRVASMSRTNETDPALGVSPSFRSRSLPSEHNLSPKRTDKTQRGEAPSAREQTHRSPKQRSSIRFFPSFGAATSPSIPSNAMTPFKLLRDGSEPTAFLFPKTFRATSNVEPALRFPHPASLSSPAQRPPFCLSSRPTVVGENPRLVFQPSMVRTVLSSLDDPGRKPEGSADEMQTCTIQVQV